MNYMQLMDTPRLYTALAEWSACFIYILILKKKATGLKLAASVVLMLVWFGTYQLIAGRLPIYMWVPAMTGAILSMIVWLRLICDVSFADAGFWCIRAFVLAQLAASLQWQLYAWWAIRFQKIDTLVSVMMMMIVYFLLFCGYFILEKNHIPKDISFDVEVKELSGAALIALSAFVISNISFVMPDTPFSSATYSILYVRTLVDFGGLVMLFAQQDKREELRLRNENQAMNILMKHQYDQYRMSMDNVELLRKEFHDMKHYMIAIRAEQNPEKREQFLTEMEHAIHEQETLTNTGNYVLDVVLTTKSAFCTQNKISFTCMADGKLISFLHVKDICSIFGNALDNSIECVTQYDDYDKRLISLSVFKQKQFLIIQIENYSESPLNLNQESLPATTKADQLHHGYGLKSIEQAARKYGGTMTLQSENNWFTLQVLIPL